MLVPDCDGRHNPADNCAHDKIWPDIIMIHIIISNIMMPFVIIKVFVPIDGRHAMPVPDARTIFNKHARNLDPNMGNLRDVYPDAGRRLLARYCEAELLQQRAFTVFSPSEKSRLRSGPPSLI